MNEPLPQHDAFENIRFAHYADLTLADREILSSFENLRLEQVLTDAFSVDLVFGGGLCIRVRSDLASTSDELHPETGVCRPYFTVPDVPMKGPRTTVEGQDLGRISSVSILSVACTFGPARDPEGPKAELKFLQVGSVPESEEWPWIELEAGITISTETKNLAVFCGLGGLNTEVTVGGVIEAGWAYQKYVQPNLVFGDEPCLDLLRLTEEPPPVEEKVTFWTRLANLLPWR